MLDALSTPQRALADYMSELSEEAYCAGWMDDLEFSLWRIVTDGSGRYGSMEITEKHVSKLRAIMRPIHALHRTRPSRHGCNRGVPRAESLILSC